MLDKWQSLYEIANKLKECSPWQWMDNSDVFVVQDPDSGVIYYCTIMGSGGMHFGVAAYRGTKGLNVLEDMMDGADDPVLAMDFLYMNDCL
ncbi:MAG: plasmid pRiA4b family protein [Firmicutes bacterium]|nr:plasmid pRiA4b family protein [Bacillota bacterium]